MKLTPIGEFVARKSVMVSHDLWSAIIKESKRLLDGADDGSCPEDGWQMFLQELQSGCQELLKDEKFLELINREEDGQT
jgi:hypothetical protein